MNGQVKNNQNVIEPLIIANDLTYEMDRSLGVCVERNYSHEPFNNGNVGKYGPSESAERIISTGDAFVHADKSLLFFTVNLKSVATTLGNVLNNSLNSCSFGKNGSALNLISSVELKSKDSELVERIESCDIYANARAQYTRSRDWMDNLGSMVGFETETQGDNLAPRVTSYTLTERLRKTSVKHPNGLKVCIPLNMLLGTFRSDKLIPSFFANGCTLKITFNSMALAFERVGAWQGIPDLTYEVTDMYCRMATCKLTDAVQARLANISADKGLRLLIDTVYHQRQESNSTVLSISLRSNIAQALALTVKTREKAVVDSQDLNGYVSAPYAFERFHFKHGTTNYPRDSVTSDIEAYAITQGSYDKIREVGLDNSVSFGRFCGYFEESSTAVASAVIHYNFEKSQKMDLTGVSLSNARVLSFEARFIDSTPRVNDLFLDYSTLLTIFPTNCVVEV